MSCRDIEPLLLTERDGVLTTKQHAALTRHVAACPACQQLRANLTEAALFLKMDAANVPVPDADDEWRALRAQLHGEKARPAKKQPLAPVIWFGAPLAVAAAVALAFFLGRPAPRPAVVPSLVETANPGAAGADGSDTATTAYVDKESGWLVVWTTDTGATKGSG